MCIPTLHHMTCWCLKNKMGVFSGLWVPDTGVDSCSAASSKAQPSTEYSWHAGKSVRDAPGLLGCPLHTFSFCRPWELVFTSVGQEFPSSPSVLSSSPQNIKLVYTSEFQPYVVFVKPPRIEELRLTRRRAKFICDEEDKSSVRLFSVRWTLT